MKRHRSWNSTNDMDKDDPTADQSNDDTEAIDAIDDNVYVLFDGINDKI